MKDYANQLKIDKPHRNYNLITAIAAIIILILIAWLFVSMSGKPCFEYIQGVGCI